MDESKIEVEPLPFEEEEPSDLLYHYTTLEGMIGIISGKSIRATHVRYLNDISEISNAFLKENIEALIGELCPGVDAQTAESLRRLMVPSEDRYDAFIVSFTDDAAVLETNRRQSGDRLSQWRGYSGKSSGFGLGFDSKKLLDAWKTCPIKDTGAGFYLLRCEYRSEEKKKAAKEVGAAKRKDFDSVYGQYTKLFYKENGRGPNENEAEDLHKRAIARVLAAAFTDYYLRAARFKDGTFSEEAEWRIVIHTMREKLIEKQVNEPANPVLHFRPGKFGLTPYINFPLSLTSTQTPLRRIVVGPSPHKSEALSAVRLLLRSNGIEVRSGNNEEGVDVVESNIPYRTW